MSKIILEGYILVNDSDLDLVKSELPKHIELTHNEKGCLLFEVSQDSENRKRFNVWKDLKIKNHSIYTSNVYSNLYGARLLPMFRGTMQ